MFPRIDSFGCLSLSGGVISFGIFTAVLATSYIIYPTTQLINSEKLEDHINIDEIKTQIVCLLVVILLSVVLVIGTVMKWRFLLIPFLLVLIVGMGFGIVMAGFSFMSSVAMWNEIWGFLLLLVSLGALGLTGLMAYVWIGVFSLYRNIGESENRFDVDNIHEKTQLSS